MSSGRREGAACGSRRRRRGSRGLAEVALGACSLQVAIGSGDDTYIGFQRLRAAEPLELALLEEAEKLRLDDEAHLTDLVEKERAAGRLLDPPRLRLEGAREGALLEAEELGLEEVLGQRRAIDRDEWARGPPRGAVDEASDALFALARAGTLRSKAGSARQRAACRPTHPSRSLEASVLNGRILCQSRGPIGSPRLALNRSQFGLTRVPRSNSLAETELSSIGSTVLRPSEGPIRCV